MVTDRKMRFFVVFWVIAFSIQNGFAQKATQPEVRPLAFGQSIESELGGGRSDRYSIEVKANDTLLLRVDQLGIDVTVALFSMSGGKLVERDSSSQDSETIIWRAPADARYLIEVKGARIGDSAGRYRIQAVLSSQLTGKDKATQAQVLIADAASLIEQGTVEAKKAGVAKFEEARLIFHEIGDMGQEAICLGALGRFSEDLGEQRKALSYFDRSLQIYVAIADESHQAMILTSIGNTHAELGENELAIEHFSRALTIRRKLHDKDGEAVTVTALGNTYQELGDKQKALAYFSQAAQLYLEIGDKKGIARTNGHLGTLFNELGDKQKAIDLFENGLVLFRADGDKVGEADLLNSLGVVYQQLGDPGAALERFVRALSLIRSVGIRSKEAGMLHSIGRAYQDIGDNKQALENFQQALALRRVLEDKNGQAETLVSMGLVYGETEGPKSSLPFLTEALTLYRQVGNKGAEATTLTNTAVVLMTLGDYEKAYGYYRDAATLARYANDRRTEAETWYGIAVLFVARENLREATFFFKQAVAQLQLLRTNIKGMNKDLQQAYLKSIEPVYRNLATFLMVQGRLPEALQILNLFKDQEQFDLAGDKKIMPPAVTVRESELMADLDRRIEALAVASREIDPSKSVFNERSPGDEQKTGSLNAKLERAKSDYEAFFASADQLFRAQPDVKDKQPSVEDLQNIQAALRETSAATRLETVAVYTVVDARNFLALIVTADSIDWTASVAKDAINIKARQLWYLLQKPTYDPRPISKEIYDLIFVPIEKKIPKSTQTILWSLDGSLRYIPMAALYDGDHYLVERYNNVVFTRSDRERITRNTSTLKTGLGMGGSEAHSVKFGGDTFNAAALPAVRTELAKIFTGKGLNGTLPGEVLLNEQFTRAAMFSALEKRRPLVHIASHFRFEPGNRSGSFLLLGDGTPLTLDDIGQKNGLFSGVDLLTLSACQTAAQQPNASGREVDGFAELAQRLGAGAVLASLWEVSDESTAELMARFYRKYASSGTDKASAIRSAQLALLKGEYSAIAAENRQLTKPDADANMGIDPSKLVLFKPPAGVPFAHPYYWSPFILIGNWK